MTRPNDRLVQKGHGADSNGRVTRGCYLPVPTTEAAQGLRLRRFTWLPVGAGL
jgi:hypothetical protein